MKKAFTLIELLVVVLIIGILAAIALPQYRVAIMKTKYVQAMALVDKLWQAQQVYYMANNEYADELDKLDISLPPGTTNSTNTITYSWGRCANGSDHTGYCYVGDSLLYLRDYTLTKRQCRAYTGKSTSDIAEQVCKSFGGSYQDTVTEFGFKRYDL